MKTALLAVLLTLLLSGCEIASHHQSMDKDHISEAIALCEKRHMGFRVETDRWDRVVEVYCVKEAPL